MKAVVLLILCCVALACAAEDPKLTKQVDELKTKFEGLLKLFEAQQAELSALKVAAAAASNSSSVSLSALSTSTPSKTEGNLQLQAQAYSCDDCGVCSNRFSALSLVYNGVATSITLTQGESLLFSSRIAPGDKFTIRGGIDKSESRVKVVFEGGSPIFFSVDCDDVFVGGTLAGGRLTIVAGESNNHLVCDYRCAVPGPKGDTGDDGPAGPAGPTGPRGAVGAAGPIGKPGAAGPQGVAGPQGPAGAVGPAGPVGPAGATGARGASGRTGPTGAVGPVGPVGAAGAKGANGATGARGAAGAAGATGAPGENGARGATGAVGPAGPRGAAGPTGPAGDVGAAGSRGATGAVGPRGPTGPVGPSALAFSSVTSGAFSFNVPRDTSSSCLSAWGCVPRTFGVPTVTFNIPSTSARVFVSGTVIVASHAYDDDEDDQRADDLLPRGLAVAPCGGPISSALATSPMKGVQGLAFSPFRRQTVSVSAVMSGFAAGNTQFGLCVAQYSDKGVFAVTGYQLSVLVFV